ncbi:hypothetical protein HY502_00015 [Candidatus Woesebacteria bacterium]|nr:hypothetical protein [Candidatus Woesebacteria bacterium]
MKNQNGFTPIIILVILALAVGGYFAYQKGLLQKRSTSPSSPMTTVPTISKEEIMQGWYWGHRDQKKPNTPSDWMFSGDGSRSDCWHKTGVDCITPPSQFCGGIQGIICPEGYTCKLDGNYPDASGACLKN